MSNNTNNNNSTHCKAAPSWDINTNNSIKNTRNHNNRTNIINKNNNCSRDHTIKTEPK